MAQIHNTHIANPDVEEQLLVEIEVDAPEEAVSFTESKLTLSLTEGGTKMVPHPPDAPFTYGGSEDVQTTVIPNRGVALGHFLHGLEIHESGAEEAVHDKLREHIDLSAYYEMQESLSRGDRRKRLFEWWDWRVEEAKDFAAEKYREDAIWRDQSLDESGRKLAERITRNVEPEGTMCYYTAGEAAIHELNNHRVSYCEGVVLPKHANQCIRHAWIEIDGSVAELTWPWHPFDGGEAVYLGMEIPKEQVKETRERRDINGSVLLDDDELREVNRAMRGEVNE